MENATVSLSQISTLWRILAQNALTAFCGVREGK